MARVRKTAPAARRGARSEQVAVNPALPFSGAHFRVLIGEKEIGFCQITRLHVVDSDSAPEREAGFLPRPPTVVLRRAITQNKDLYRWRARVAAGKRELRTVTIQQCDPGGTTILNTWVLHECRPVRWSGPEFNALASDLLWEEVEITCERLDWL